MTYIFNKMVVLICEIHITFKQKTYIGILRELKSLWASVIF